jgi:hypothetical protein
MRVSWTYLKAHIKNAKLQSGCLLARSEKTNDLYDRFKGTKRDLRTYILKTYLKDKWFTIVPNAFPYELRKGIDQYVLFAVEPLEQKEYIDAILHAYFPHKQILWYINAPHLQSIPTVWHCQVFVK